MKTTIAISALTSVLVLGLPASAGDLQSDLMANEKALWMAADSAPYVTLVAEDAVAVGRAGIITGRESMIKELAIEDCKMNKADLRDAQLHQIGPDVVLLNYNVTYDEVCKGKPDDGKLVVSAVWKKQDGKWVEALFHSTSIK